MSYSEETLRQLQHKFQRLQEENKKLRQKASSIDVLTNLLESYEDENKQLKEHILELQSANEYNSLDEEQMVGKGVSSARGYASPCRDNPSKEDHHSKDDCKDTEHQTEGTVDSTSDQGGAMKPEDIETLQSNMATLQLENTSLSDEIESLADFLSQKNVEDQDAQAAAADLVHLRARVQKFGKESIARKIFLDILSDEKHTLDAKITDAISDKSDLNGSKELLRKIKKGLNKEDDQLSVRSDSSVTSVSSSQEGNDETYVMVPKAKPERTELVHSLDEKDASPMNSFDGSPPPSITSEYVLVQKLQEQVSAMTKEKEELLNVNHQWDIQYRQVEKEKSQEIEALRTELLRARQDLDSVHTKELEKRKEFDRLWATMHDKFEQAKEIHIQEKESLEARNRQLEGCFQQMQARYEEIKHRNATLEENIGQFRQMTNQWTPLPSLTAENLPQEVNLKNVYQQRSPFSPVPIPVPSAPTMPISRPPATGASIPQVPPVEAPPPSNPGVAPPKETLAKGVTVEEIEMLKQQINVYAEDFRTERADRERIQAEKETMKEEMSELKERLTALQQQVRMNEEDFQRERTEKTRLLRQLQAFQGVQVPPPEYHTERVTAEQIRAEERRLREMKDSLYNAGAGLPRYNPAYPRGGHYRELAQWHLAARGPSQNAEQRRRFNDDMFHGGDVVPDSDLDVKDG